MSLVTDKDFGLTSEQLDSLKSQCESEFNFAVPYMSSWWDRKLEQLRIYNNQDKDPMVVSDNLLYTTMQTAMASLYDDKPLIQWSKRSNEDEQLAENLTFMTKFDYDVMGMDRIRYMWIWNTLFFGRGLVFMYEWDRKNLVPVPKVLNPMTTIRDPKAVSVNGTMSGEGAARFLGWEVLMTQGEMKADKAYKDIDVEKLNNDPLPVTDGKNFVDMRRDRATDTGHNDNFEEGESLTGDNRQITLLRWLTNFNGKKVIVELADGLTEVVRYIELKTDYWPVFDRTLSPQTDSWDGVSISDMTEDKQRANARLLNNVLRSVETTVDPRYIYDKRVIRNKRTLIEHKFNKYVPADGPIGAAIAPIPKDIPRIDAVNWVRETLGNVAEAATATPELKTGQVGTTNKTATELALVNQKVDDRFSLLSKVFGWSEKDFWREWYRMYERNMSNRVDEKMVIVKGPGGESVKPMKKEDIVSREISPDVKVDSEILSEARRMNKLNALSNLKMQLAQSPGVNIRYLDQQLAAASGLDIEEANRLLPKSPDEMNAELENKKILDNKYPGDAETGEDHAMHFETHAKMDQEDKNLVRHIKTHDAAIILEQDNAELQKQPQLNTQDQERLMMQGEGQETQAPQIQDQTFQTA